MKINSTLADFKINQFLPLIPKGNWLIFQLSPFWVWGKKAEKSQKNLICQSSIKFNNLEKHQFILDILGNLINCITTIQYL